MASTQALAARASDLFGDFLRASRVSCGELTLDVEAGAVERVCRALRDDPELRFEQLIDLAGVDFSAYGAEDSAPTRPAERFAVVYHLLSVTHNHRVRVRAFVDGEPPVIASLVDIWVSANWYEREAFDLFGIVFEGHPDLRRILTDYGFVGHPFRKDFPLSGHVEMRYDPDKRRVVYEPVSIEPRVLVPRVIREEGFGDRNP